jgi:hypothetical protein
MSFHSVSIQGKFSADNIVEVINLYTVFKDQKVFAKSNHDVDIHYKGKCFKISLKNSLINHAESDYTELFEIILLCNFH